jgi:uncharacterized BrkB/YihY/UPF0761 family membrane protein
VLPNVKLDWNDVWIGAAATSALFMLESFSLAYTSEKAPSDLFTVRLDPL